ncbi:GNAT family N-acetyltransferase [Herpetosiphon geysericola]|uniref:GCN5 family acetyltransferase n=1 Tax=Herpetosiphon geysericola TaxID=70996 RepID=A0A0P6Z2E0_9CHLR|nr:GNAT family N-acetyltransferase [Herpetosiphon geysericola]KPL91376.1 GCN5 family acetyltransferase [Herpetosiphon geysericola]
MSIRYSSDTVISAEQFVVVLNASTLGERRPVDDLARMQAMIDNADLIVTAWDGEKLIGVARTITDWCYAAYLSDLAVDQSYQKQGLGRQLIEATREKLGDQCSLVLLAAPAAADYYAKVGFESIKNGWQIKRTS